MEAENRRLGSVIFFLPDGQRSGAARNSASTIFRNM
jgi:hypothetical protein